MKIGITEQGDASRDLSWKYKLSLVDGTILITKNVTEQFIWEVIAATKKGYKIIVHATCTGWGKSIIEPNVPDYKEQLNQLYHLVQEGFPLTNCVLRIDPIIPTKEGLDQVLNVINYAYYLKLLPNIRVRISILDEYAHVKDRIKAKGYNPFYGDKFAASQEMFTNVVNTLSQTSIKYETCAEPILSNHCDSFEQVGCISKKDLDIMGLTTMDTTINPQNRRGCLCLACKLELLSCKHQCANGCLYCYWR